MALVEAVVLFLTVYRFVIIAAAIVTWIPTVPRYHPAVQFLNRVTDPILRPIRAILPPEKTGYIDFSPIVALIVLEVIQRLLVQAIVAAPPGRL